MIPTLLGIMVINFALIQFVPGGPIEQIIAQLEGGGDVFESFAGGGSELAEAAEDSDYVGARGLPPEFLEELEREFGFDKPPLERFLTMMWKYIRFDFGESYFKNETVIALVVDKLPVSISLGLWSTLIAYLISIPLGIQKAVRDGSTFDTWTSGAIIVGFAIPSFLFAVLLIVLFSGGSYLDWFPLRGLASDSAASQSWFGRAGEYLPYVAAIFLATVAVGQIGMGRVDQTERERQSVHFATWATGALVVVSALVAIAAGDMLGSRSQHIWIVALPAALAIVNIRRLLRRKDRAEWPERPGTLYLKLLLAGVPGVLWSILILACLSVAGVIGAVPDGATASPGGTTLFGRIGDYFWHMALPVLATTIGAFATLTLLTKNSFLDEIKKQYVMSARAKGLTERRVMYGHVFRNGMLIVISGFPGVFVAVFFTGSVLIETLFSLDGLGRLGFEAVIARDYPIMFGTLFFFSLVGLVMGIITDLTYVLIDPRIDFESRG